MTFLQETHNAICDENYWRNEWGGTIIFSNGSMRSRGVCILFKPSLYVQIVKSECHVDGRYVIMDMIIADCMFTVVCLYGPNLDQPLFFNDFIRLLNTFHAKNIIFGGDFNFVFNLNLDKKQGTRRTNYKARDECLKIMDYFDLVDIWRERNPFSEKFTWRSSITPGIFCRLDFFLISKHLKLNVSSDGFISGLRSDHSFVLLVLSVGTHQRGPGFWKINNSLLNDDNYLNLINGVLRKGLEITQNDYPPLRWDYLKYMVRVETIPRN